MVMIALLLVISAHVLAHGAARFVFARVLGVKYWLVRRFITATGPFANYVLAAMMVFAGHMIGGREYLDEATMEIDVVPGGPADRAGLRSGDRIMMINDEQPENWDVLQRIVASHAGEPVDITLERGEREMHVAATPGAPGTPEQGKLLMSPPRKSERVGFLRAAKLGLLEPIKAPLRGLIAVARTLRGRRPTELYGPGGVIRAERRSTSIGELLKLMGSLGGLLLPLFALVMLLPPRRFG
jgi:regulator of sigma E protease